MAESCLVCSEDFEGDAYGPCGHRGACATCVVRLRLISRYHLCPICRMMCDHFFVTKASAKARTDVFATFPIKPLEGPVDSFWYHEGSKTFFDDFEEYKRIKELCGIKCTSCGKADFSCIGDLMIHLHEQHRLYLCTVCLVDREQFVCEQKLFAKEDLEKHIVMVDSNEGITGHPHCLSCRHPFYADEKIFIHDEPAGDTCKCHFCYMLSPDTSCPYRDAEAHFCVIHAGGNDAFKSSTFSVPRSFRNEDDLLRHYDVEHLLSVATHQQVAPTNLLERKVLKEKLWQYFFKGLKDKSHKFGNGIIDAETYVAELEAVGLQEFVPQLARFCQKIEKKKALLHAYNGKDE